MIEYRYIDICVYIYIILKCNGYFSDTWRITQEKMIMKGL